MTWLLDRVRNLILPLTVIILGGLTGLVRFMRASMLDEINQEYVLNARAKELSDRVFVFKHALRNSHRGQLCRRICQPYIELKTKQQAQRVTG